MDWASILAGLSGYGNVGEGAIQPPAADFASRFGAAGAQGVPPAPVAPQPMQSPISPEALASQAAARGLPPPPVDLAPPIRMPSAEQNDAWRAGVDGDMSKPGAVGAALTGKTVGAPMDIRPPVQQQQQDGATDMSAQSKPKNGMDKFAESLKGVKMPASPELQRLGTPAAPRPTGQIKGGDLIALLQALNAAPGASSYNLPSTLGAAIRK